MRKLIAAAVVTAAFALPAAANPAAGVATGTQPGANTAVELVHGWHRGCERGPRGFWHYHDRFGAHACDPRPVGPWIWHFEGGRWGWWHPQHRRWHR